MTRARAPRAACRSRGGRSPASTPRAGGARPAPRSAGRPDSATSPASTVPARTGRSRRLEARAVAIARSAAGSSMRRPPATFTYTSWPERLSPAWRARTAMSISTRFVSMPGRRPARRAVAGRRAERLDLDGQRARSLERDRDGGSGRRRLVLRLEEEAAGVVDLGQAVAAHLEHADLVRRAEPVLRRAQQARRPQALALEVDHRIDEVLERPRPGDRSLLGDVADEGDARPARPSPAPPAAPPPRAPGRRCRPVRRARRSSGSGRSRPPPAPALRPLDRGQCRLEVGRRRQLQAVDHGTDALGPARGPAPRTPPPVTYRTRSRRSAPGARRAGAGASTCRCPGRRRRG